MGVMKLALSRMDFLGGQNRFYPVAQTNHWREEPAEVNIKIRLRQLVVVRTGS
jgi:hypothetical protein